MPEIALDLLNLLTTAGIGLAALWVIDPFGKRLPKRFTAKALQPVRIRQLHGRSETRCR